MQTMNLSELFDRFDEHWSPKTVAAVNDHELKVAKVLGEFTWHSHDVDELFVVLDGQLSIDLQDHTVTLGPDDVFVVPKGVEHRPRAEVETRILLLEPRGVVNTGDAGGPLTAEAQSYVDS